MLYYNRIVLPTKPYNNFYIGETVKQFNFSGNLKFVP